MAQDVSERLASVSHSVLVAGIDGSGKSTFLDQLATHLGYTVMEPTSTEAARVFKTANLNTLLDGAFIDERELLYLGLNAQFDRQLEMATTSRERVATTGSSLVTLLSHSVMRGIVVSHKMLNVGGTVDRWLDDGGAKPAALALVYAPDSTILERIKDRQLQGDNAEKFWGFNAPYFLSQYQEAWHMALDLVRINSDIVCVDFDSSQVGPDDITTQYSLEVLGT